MSKTRFKFNCNNMFVQKDAESGKMYVTGIASDTIEDNDTERMSKQALMDMKDGISEKVNNNVPITFLPNHNATFGIGNFVDSDVVFDKRSVIGKDGKIKERDVYELFVKAELDPNDSRAVKLFDNIENYQMSIGGFIDHEKPNPVFYETKEGKKRRVINRLKLDHIAATRKGWASVGRSRFESSFVKGQEISVCNVANQIFKSIEYSNDSDNFTEKEQEMGDQGELGKVAKRLGGRFGEFLNKSNEIEETTIVEDTNLLRMVTSDIARISEESKKLGRELDLSEVRKAYDSLGVILKEEDKIPEVIETPNEQTTDVVNDTDDATNKITTDDVATDDVDDDKGDEGNMSAKPDNSDEEGKDSVANDNLATDDTNKNIDFDELKSFLKGELDGIEKRQAERFDNFKRETQSNEAVDDAISTPAVSKQSATNSGKAATPKTANSEDFMSGILNKAVKKSGLLSSN